jgi:hypothetical protein
MLIKKSILHQGYPKAESSLRECIEAAERLLGQPKAGQEPSYFRI